MHVRARTPAYAPEADPLRAHLRACALPGGVLQAGRASKSPRPPWCNTQSQPATLAHGGKHACTHLGEYAEAHGIPRMIPVLCALNLGRLCLQAHAMGTGVSGGGPSKMNALTSTVVTHQFLSEESGAPEQPAAAPAPTASPLRREDACRSAPAAVLFEPPART